MSSDIINKLFSIDDVIFVSTQFGLNYIGVNDSYFKSIDSDDGLGLSDYSRLRFSTFNNKLIVEDMNDQYSIDVSMLTKETTASEVVVKEIVGTDSRNNDHMLTFMNGEVIVPTNITSV